LTATTDNRTYWAPRRFLRRSHFLALPFLVLLAAIVIAPLVTLAVIAIRGDADIWRHLWTYVVPNAALDTAGLLTGVAVLTALAGIGAAWLVTAHDFPGRTHLVWLLPLPLAFPTYIVAYVYVDIFDAAGPVQTAFRALFGYRTASEYWLPSIRSLPGAILVMSLVLYPSPRARCF